MIKCWHYVFLHILHGFLRFFLLHCHSTSSNFLSLYQLADAVLRVYSRTLFFLSLFPFFLSAFFSVLSLVPSLLLTWFTHYSFTTKHSAYLWHCKQQSVHRSPSVYSASYSSLTQSQSQAWGTSVIYFTLTCMRGLIFLSRNSSVFFLHSQSCCKKYTTMSVWWRDLKIQHNSSVHFYYKCSPHTWFMTSINPGTIKTNINIYSLAFVILEHCFHISFLQSTAFITDHITYYTLILLMVIKPLVYIIYIYYLEIAGLLSWRLLGRLYK